MPEEAKGKRRRWIKFWTQEWISGIRREMEPDERSVLADFLALAGDSPEPGTICAFPGVPFTDDQLCRALQISPELLERARKKMIKHGLITLNDGLPHIVNWERDQAEFDKSEYMRKYMQEYRKKRKKGK